MLLLPLKFKIRICRFISSASPINAYAPSRVDVVVELHLHQNDGGVVATNDNADADDA